MTTVARALEVRSALRAIEPRVNYLMSLYLHPSVTADVVAEAAAAGVFGIKMYPQGVTTNSEAGAGADFLDAYAPVLRAMEHHGLVLNLHGEVPNAEPTEELSLEEAFLPQLGRLHEMFPGLRVVLEVSFLSFCLLSSCLSPRQPKKEARGQVHRLSF